jgi:hypothetical protein
MRWVKDGPDIPGEIVRAVEDGRVVFFCGAGVSQQAGLPGFRGLVEAVYAKLHRRRESFPVEERAFTEKNYDQVFASLEAAIKERGLIRRLVADSLVLTKDADTNTHKALLTLATDHSGKCHMVTTNYDRCFVPYLVDHIRVDAVPRLPLPRPGRWNSVVHLHGFLDDCGEDRRELVLSSADFGSAYLVDGWATRFLRELFQHFIVLFVGYRADDLVVKYMLQALAVGFAERGENPKAFALAQIEETEESTMTAWEAKGITPILYPKARSHDVLHATLRAWAEASSLGLLGRRSVVAERLAQPPPSDHDEVVDQVVWALQDENGAIARYLAEHEAAPAPKYWLCILGQRKLLALDDVPLVGPVGTVPSMRPIHPITWNLGRWLARHLDENVVLNWAIENGGSLHANFRKIIRQELEKQRARLCPEIEKAWTFLARHQPDPATNQFCDPFTLGRRIQSEGWDLQLKSDVASFIEPHFVVVRDRVKEISRKPVQAGSDELFIEVDVRLNGGKETEFVLDALRKRSDHDSILSCLLSGCTLNLQRAMEVQEYFGTASSEHDWTYIWLRSIRTSGSERYGRPVVTLITLAAA